LSRAAIREVYLRRPDDPVWEPLENLVGREQCGDFMFMGSYSPHDSADPSEWLHAYKHRYTRRYLFLALDGVAYRYEGHVNGYRAVGCKDALAHVFG